MCESFRLKSRQVSDLGGGGVIYEFVIFFIILILVSFERRGWGH